MAPHFAHITIAPRRNNRICPSDALPPSFLLPELLPPPPLPPLVDALASLYCSPAEKVFFLLALASVVLAPVAVQAAVAALVFHRAGPFFFCPPNRTNAELRGPSLPVAPLALFLGFSALPAPPFRATLFLRTPYRAPVRPGLRRAADLVGKRGSCRLPAVRLCVLKERTRVFCSFIGPRRGCRGPCRCCCCCCCRCCCCCHCCSCCCCCCRQRRRCRCLRCPGSLSRKTCTIFWVR